MKASPFDERSEDALAKGSASFRCWMACAQKVPHPLTSLAKHFDTTTAHHLFPSLAYQQERTMNITAP